MRIANLLQMSIITRLLKFGIVASVLIVANSASLNVFAQGISAADLNSLKSGMALQGAASGGLGVSNLPGMLAIQVPQLALQDDEDTLKDGKK